MNRRSRRGFVLIFVLVVIAMLTLAALSFGELMVAERRAAMISAQQVQARALADSGIEMVRNFLAQPEATQTEWGGCYDNPSRLRGVLTVDDEDARRRGRFTIIVPRLEDRTSTGFRYGLEDQSARINLSTLLNSQSSTTTGGTGGSGGTGTTGGTSGAGTTSGTSTASSSSNASNNGRQILMKLPGMTEEIADAILDWIDEDDTPREYGAESEYYSSLVPAYAARNALPATIDELLLVRGVTPQLLFGTDTDRNGRQDTGEPLAESIENVDNSDGSMNGGWASYLTLNSAETNLQSDGTAKINLNQDDMQTLYNSLKEAFDAEWAAYIVLYRQYGAAANPSGTPATSDSITMDFTKKGSTTLKSVLDLIDTRVSIAQQQSQQQQQSKQSKQQQQRPKILTSPFKNDTGSMGTYLPQLLEKTTTDTKEAITGRININQAPRAVLKCIPGMTDEIVEQIISNRNPDPLAADASHRYPTWLLTEGVVPLATMKTLLPYVTGAGNVYRVQVVGYFEGGRPFTRLEAILDATKKPPDVVFWRDISHLGRGHSLETLGQGVSD